MKKPLLIFLILFIAFLLITPALAQTNQTGGYNLITNIPGVGEITDISDYIKVLYLFGLAIVGVIAMLFIIIGGIRYMTAAGNEAGITEAKGQITSAILGLVLVLTSWLILHTVNPELVSLKKLNIPKVNTVDPTGEHLKCINNECVLIPTAGTSDPNCPREGAACLNTYLDCVDVNGALTCQAIEGDGQNQHGCTQAGEPCPVADECSDEIDNDGDGREDDNDPCCLIAPGDSERHEGCAQCDDELDNDQDTYYDLDDPECSGPDDNDEWPPNP